MNGNIKIGDTIEHGGMQFVITKIDMNENLESKHMYIQASDASTADHQQQKSIEQENIQAKVMGLLGKLMEGPPRGMGGGV